LRYQCSPFRLNSALYPIIEQSEFAAGFAREDTVEQKLDKLEAILAGSPTRRKESAPLLATCLKWRLRMHLKAPLRATTRPFSPGASGT
jgi:hypothetical protein